MITNNLTVCKNILKAKATMFLVFFIFIGILQLSAQPSPLTFTKGRIALSHDGNSYDYDDFLAVAMEWGIFASFGVQDKVVHWDICDNTHLNTTFNYNEQLKSARGATLFPGFADLSTFLFDDFTQLPAAIANFKKQAELSSVDDPLYFICAGPMEVPWQMVNAVKVEFRKYITCISHSTWNEDFSETNSTHTWAIMKTDFVKDGVKFVDLNDQNKYIGTDKYDFSWLNNMPAGTCIDPAAWAWIATRDIKGDTGKGKWDCSDAGMVWYLLTGEAYGTGPAFKERFLNPICKNLIQDTIRCNSNPSNGGEVLGCGSFNKYSSVSLTAKANVGYKFSSWSGDVSGVSNPVSVTMNGNKNVTANFSIDDNPNQNPVSNLSDWVLGTTNTKVAGNSRLMAVMVMGESTADFAAEAVTYGGRAMTKQTEKMFFVSGNRSYASIFTLNEAGVNAATDGTIAVTWSTTPSSGNSVYSVLLKNVDQTTPVVNPVNSSLTGITIATTPVVAANGDMVIMCGATENNVIQTFNNGFVKQFETNTAWGDGVGGFKIGTGVSETPQFTQSASGRMVLCSIVVKNEIPTNLNGANAENNNLHIHQDPLSNFLNISFSSAGISRVIKVFSACGQLLYSVQTKNATTKIDVKSLKIKGIVLIQVSDGKEISSHKVII